MGLLVLLAAVLPVLSGLLAVLAGLPLWETVSVATILLLLVIVVLLLIMLFESARRLSASLGTRDSLEADLARRTQRVEQAEAEISALRQSLSESTKALRAAGSAAATLKADKDDLQRRMEDLVEKHSQLAMERADLFARHEAAQRQVEQLSRAAEGLKAEVRSEQESTARAQMQPLIRPSLDFPSGGWFRAKRVVIRVENIGTGNAKEVEVAGISGPRDDSKEAQHVNYYPALKPGEQEETDIGSVDEFASRQWIDVVVKYRGEFGFSERRTVRKNLR